MTGAVRPASRPLQGLDGEGGAQRLDAEPAGDLLDDPRQPQAAELAGVDEAELASVVEGEHVVGELVTRLGTFDDGHGAGHAEVDASQPSSSSARMNLPRPTQTSHRRAGDA